MSDYGKSRKEARKLAVEAMERIINLRDFASIISQASWMKDTDEKSFWESVEIIAENMHGDIDSLIDDLS